MAQNGVPESFTCPATVVLEGKRLAETKARLAEGGHDLMEALGFLTVQADKWLGCGPWAVANKKILPPSGDKHDYASQAPYWWPSPNGGTAPYIQRDGERNPECKQYTDKDDRERMFESSYVLALAWYYTGNRLFAQHSGNIIRTWFLSPETRMNPNLNHAQIIPGINTGRAIGIIDFSQGYTSVLDAAAILDGAPGWTLQDMQNFQEWNRDFLKWLDGEFGTKEKAERNNHGTFATMQTAAIALFVGDTAKARKEVLSMMTFIDEQIAADGSQPLELKRTRSWHYSTFNLVAYTRGAAIGKKLGVDLWNYMGAQGGSINKAVDFIIPYAIGESAKEWMFPELRFEAFGASDIIHAAADAGNCKAKAALSKLSVPPKGDLWELRPAVEQLDPVK
jgi:hypothetical protein